MKKRWAPSATGASIHERLGLAKPTVASFDPRSKRDRDFTSSPEVTLKKGPHAARPDVNDSDSDRPTNSQTLIISF